VPETSSYNVVLLVEENLTADDAARIRSLHDGIDEPIAYHVLMPMIDGPARVQAAMGSLGAPDLVPGPSITLPDIDPAEVLEEAKRESEDAITTAVRVLQAAGANASGELVTGDPIDALSAKVAAVDGREAIILTEEHFVAELLRLDWTSKARRHLDIPVLHLMEQETFDGQAGGGEGVTGL
jgi:nucleotide-binding universal stress UspA family protein